MIWDALVAIGLAILAPVLAVVSFEADAVVGTGEGFLVVAQALGQGNRYVPVDQFIVLTLAGLVYDLVLTGATFGVWVYRLIPFKAT